MNPEKRKAEIVRQYNAGVKTTSIAAQFGVDSSYPGKLARKMGSPARGYLRVSEATKAAIYADYCDAKMTIREIADKYDVSDSYPTKLARQRGGPRRYDGNRKPKKRK